MEDPVAPLLTQIAGLPAELVREIALFAFAEEAYDANDAMPENIDEREEWRYRLHWWNRFHNQHQGYYAPDFRRMTYSQLFAECRRLGIPCGVHMSDEEHMDRLESFSETFVANAPRPSNPWPILGPPILEGLDMWKVSKEKLLAWMVCGNAGAAESSQGRVAIERSGLNKMPKGEIIQRLRAKYGCSLIKLMGPAASPEERSNQYLIVAEDIWGVSYDYL